jgi:hypothetical protein
MLPDREFISLPLATSRNQDATVTPQKSINSSNIQNVQTNFSAIHNVQLAIMDTNLPNINISHLRNCSKISFLLTATNVKSFIRFLFRFSCLSMEFTVSKRPGRMKTIIVNFHLEFWLRNPSNAKLRSSYLDGAQLWTVKFRMSFLDYRLR